MKRKIYIPILTFFVILGVGLIAYGVITLMPS